jgi:hypothetical protein
MIKNTLMRKTFLKSHSGFSLIEMLVATVLVMILSATSYRVLSKQGSSQRENVVSQKKNNQMLAALDRFKKDVQMIDPQWLKFGVASIFPHQGLGFAENFYVNSFIRSEGLNDGVTFLRRDIEKAELYTLEDTAEFPVATQAGAVELYDTWLDLVEPTSNIASNDFVVVYQAGKFAIGVVTRASNSPPRFMMRMPNSTERESTFLNGFGRTTGHTLKSGVIVGSFDVDGTSTSTSDDNLIRFDTGRAQVQVVEPVTYEIDYATTNGLKKSASNQYLFDEVGNRKKVIVRTEYTPPGINREYLAEANQLGITYDALRSTTDSGADSLQGYTDGDVVRDIGRDALLPLQFVNLSMDPASITMDDPSFISTNRILSMRMFVGNNLKEGGATDQKINEIRVAVDPSRKNDQFQEAGRTLANSSGNLADNLLDFNGKMIGQPLYMKRGGTSTQATDLYIPGSGDIDVVVPVSSLNAASETFENGKLVLFKDDGTLAGTSEDDTEIRFSAGANSYFYPSTMTETTSGGYTTVLVGGFSVTTDNPSNPTTVTRTPTMATITFDSSFTFREYVAANNNISNFAGQQCTSGTCTTGGGCSLLNCKLKTIAPSEFVSGTSPASIGRLKDTSAGIATDGGDVYVASMTRSIGADSTMSIYKTNTSMTQFTEKVVDDTGISSQRVISALAQSPITIAGTKYLPICTSRSISTAAQSNPQEDGKILLYDLSGATAAPIEIATHNYKCKTLTTMGGSLVVAGKLVTQVITDEEIAAIVAGNQPAKPVYTDEVANHIRQTNTNIYADGYYTLSGAYVNPVPTAPSGPTYQNVLGGHTGFSSMQLDPLTYGVVMGNKSMMIYPGRPGDPPINGEQNDFTTMTVNFGGMAERVIASIDTDFGNLNASGVVTKYGRGESKIPAILLPGNLYSNDLSPRTTPAKLPAVATTMDDREWFDFYQDYTDIVDRSDPNNPVAPPYLPSPVEAIFQCGNTIPATCQAGG